MNGISGQQAQQQISMSIELTSFAKSYQQAVKSIKNIKTSNKNLQNETSTLLQQSEAVLQNKRKVEKWIRETESSYLDPQTARRLDIIKEQLQSECCKYEAIVKKQTENNKETTRGESDEDQGFQEIQIDMESESRILQEKSREIHEAHTKLHKINSIAMETKTLTYEQGENLDFISDNFNETLANTKQSSSYLAEANVEHKKSQKKYTCLIVLGAAALVLVIVLMVALI